MSVCKSTKCNKEPISHNFSYCSLHKCFNESCDAPHPKDFSFCSEHVYSCKIEKDRYGSGICMIDGCNQPMKVRTYRVGDNPTATIMSLFCHKHTCRSLHCTAPALVGDSSPYCIGHRCKVCGTYEYRMNTEDICGIHR